MIFMIFADLQKRSSDHHTEAVGKRMSLNGHKQCSNLKLLENENDL